MAYSGGATSELNGNQQISISPLQELTSLNANKILLGVMKHGVYNAEVEISNSNPANVIFTIKAGATFIFEKNDVNPPNSSLVGKFYLEEDATISVARTTLETYTTETALAIIATWSYSVSNTSEIYAKFLCVPYDTNNISQIALDNDLVLALVLNHQVFLTNIADATVYKVSYEKQLYRNVLQSLFDRSTEFPVNFGHDGLSLSVGVGNTILGHTYIHNQSSLSCNSSNWPSPVATGTPADWYQIDVLRIKTERDDSLVNTPYLEWTSVLNGAVLGSSIREYIDGVKITYTDAGYILLYCVRNRDGLLATTPIWSENCLIVNPLTPQVGMPETLTRFKLPVY